MPPLWRSDLPLDRDASGRFLPWIIGFMVYLAALALAATLVLDSLMARWQTGLVGQLTVELPPPASEIEGGARLERVVALLAGDPAVAGAEPLADREVADLLEPWLGGNLLDLPLPDLIAVELQPGVTDAELAALRERLAVETPEATMDDHGRWLADVGALVRALKLLAALVLSLVAVAAVITVVFVTRTGLSIHRRVIELVHLVGAKDAYIAKQFQAHALRLGLTGGLVGVGLAGATLVGLDRVLDRVETPLLPPLELHLGHWILLALLPAAAAGIAMLTARITVLRSLNRVM